MRDALTFRRLRASDCLTIEMQGSQRTVMGLDAEMGWEEAELHAAQPVGWTAVVSDPDGSMRILACFGISETFPGQVGVGWAMLASGLGKYHLQLTRFVSKIIGTCPLPRLEVIAPCSNVELIAREYPQFDPWALVQAAMAEPTRECRWALMLGLQPVHVLRRHGAADESYMLFERIL